MNNFDTSKYQLGKLCKRGHDWDGTGQSLRTKRNECRDCNRIVGARPKVASDSASYRFWSKVKKTMEVFGDECCGKESSFPQTLAEYSEEAKTSEVCWHWQGYLCADGYGRFAYKGLSTTLTHRIAYELHYKCCILPVYNLCHTCDTPSCCNPHHLFIGTQAENNADKKHKGRACFGSKNYGTHLTEQDVFDIRSRYIKGSRTDGTVAIAKNYNMSKEAIAHIISRRTWKHI